MFIRIDNPAFELASAYLNRSPKPVCTLMNTGVSPLHVLIPLNIGHISGGVFPRRSHEMTNKITLNLITCRTIQQGVGMEAGKTSQKYFDAASIIHMHEDDMKKLGILANTNVRVTSKDGTIVVKAVRTREDLVPGLAHLPMGPWANAIVSAYTYSTGEPCFKGFDVDVEPAEKEKIMGAVELVQTLCYGADRKPQVRQ